jgi:predicted nucleic acid-binding protein
LIINDVIYAELSVRFATMDALDETLAALRANIAPIPRQGLFLAAKAFKRYRERNGTPNGVLPDFFIGGHASAEGCPLLTRYRGGFRDF